MSGEKQPAESGHRSTAWLPIEARTGGKFVTGKKQAYNLHLGTLLLVVGFATRNLSRFSSGRESFKTLVLNLSLFFIYFYFYFRIHVNQICPFPVDVFPQK